MRRRDYSTLTIFALFAALFTACSARFTVFNEHVILAWSLIHGHPWIDVNVWEHIVVRGHPFILHPPLSAIVCMPLVALRGPWANQAEFSAVIGGLDVALVWRMISALRPDDPRARAWLTAFFALGTVLWYEAIIGASWGFALVLSCVPTLMALTECFDRKRPAVVGAWAGVAFLARYDLILVWPIYVALIYRRRALLWFALAAVPSLIFYVAFNEWRFGTYTDISVWRWYYWEPFGAVAHPGLGPFSLSYLPYSLYTAIFMAPGFQFHFPWIRPQANGQALIFTSPALLLALRASLTKRVMLLWGAVGLGMSAALSVYSNGVMQFGARYWIQVLPFAVALMALGWRDDRVSRGLIVASILLCVTGAVTVRILGFP